MDKNNNVSLLKDLLKREVSNFCSLDGIPWKEPVETTIRELREANWRAVFFGGTLRSLIMSRLLNRMPGRPRDIDLVVKDKDVSRIRDRFLPWLTRETRFGGLQLLREHYHFDLWPLDRTWALIQDETFRPDFHDLPRTTFFNLESIAIDAWAPPGQPRMIYSGDDQFFKGIIDQVVEINFLDNPFPELCVLRGLLLSHGLGFRLGSHLSQYVLKYGMGISPIQFDNLQEKHYGKIRQTGSTLHAWVRHVSESITNWPDRLVELPTLRQPMLWPEFQNWDPFEELNASRGKVLRRRLDVKPRFPNWVNRNGSQRLLGLST